MSIIRSIHLMVMLGAMPVISLHGISTSPYETPAEYLTKRGYELTEETMRNILAHGMKKEEILSQPGVKLTEDDHLKLSVDVTYCIKYIEEQKMAALALDVKKYYDYENQKWLEMKNAESGKRINRYITTELKRMICISCLLAIDQGLSQSDIEQYLVEIRYGLYEVESNNFPVIAYNALVKAHEYRQIDIKDDLVYLCKLPESRMSYPQGKLFKLYGAELSEQEISALLSAWKDNPKMYNSIKSLCETSGITVSEATEQPASSDDFRKILAGKNYIEWNGVIRYIQKANDLALIPDVKDLFLRIGQEIEAAPAESKAQKINLLESAYLASAECILSIDPSLDANEQKVYLDAIRSSLFNPIGRTSQTRAFNCLIRLKSNKDVNIKQDLLRLGKISQVFNRAPQRLLFQYYGAELSDGEVLELNAAWADDQPMLDYLISLNHQRQTE